MRQLLRRVASLAQPGARAGRADPLAAIVPPMRDEAGRIALTTSCRDADAIPKVAGAGSVEPGDGQATQLMHNGLRVVASGYYGAWMQTIIERLRGHHEPQEEAAFHALLPLLPPDATMIELGAFWSYYTLWFLHGAPARRAAALEPDPGHLEIGRRNAALNGLAPDFVHGVAAGQDGPPAPFTTETAGVLDLPRRSVAGLMRAHGFTTLDLLHCDAQGAEAEILPAIAPLLRAGAIRFLVVSTHHHLITGDPLTHQRCLASLEAAGAAILCEHDVQESFSGDGLIVAASGGVPAGWVAPTLSRARNSESLFRNPLYDLAQR
jgi:FkbM family methyltransferase